MNSHHFPHKHNMKNNWLGNNLLHQTVGQWLHASHQCNNLWESRDHIRKYP